MKYRPYVVRSGDYLTRLATIHGFDPAQTWNASVNEELRTLRKNPEKLSPGDVLFIPHKQSLKHPIGPGNTHTFSVTIPRVSIELCFRESDKPLADEPYIIEGVTEEDIIGRTGTDGKIRFEVSVKVSSVWIEFPRRRERRLVRIGGYSNTDHEEGVRSRLRNLGFLHEPARDIISGHLIKSLGSQPEPDPDQLLAQSIRAFQIAHKLPVTGQADARTLALLEEKGEG